MQLASVMNSPCPKTDHDPTQYLCEHSRDPFDDCYCRQVTGRTVPNIALYCMERFRECPVYRKHALQNK